MRVKFFTTTAVAVAISTFALVSHAGNASDNNAGHNWKPRPQGNQYWQAPDWSNFNFSPSNKPVRPAYAPPQRPAYERQRPPVAPPAAQQPPAYRPPYQANRPATRPDSANMRPAAPYANQAYPPAPHGPYTTSGPRRLDNGASAFNMPGNNRYRDNRSRSNKFWGRSGPGRWMNPNKGNMEQGWDDMLNAPSRMGEMPGGWTAPEVSVPNPIDIGDQMQENVEDLPDQVRNMDTGN